MAEQKEVAAIPLAEERLAVEKRQVEAGRLRIRVSVDEREERVPVELDHDEVEIERVPKNLTVSELPAVRVEGNTTIIPVVEEVAVLEKRLVVVEEIHVRRKTVTGTEEIPVTLRSEQAAVERERGPASTNAASTNAASANAAEEGR
ncbi:MAG TPA: YsnF/AvaK domain-containing protein [Allosphingosinicella sp.]|nr:YsnF/AvaK domain-containing protein [Allosphingosinicella sp.]